MSSSRLEHTHFEVKPRINYLQERLRELPGLAGPEIGPSPQNFGRSSLVNPLPGFELNQVSGPHNQDFLQGFSADHPGFDQGFNDAWEEARQPGFTNPSAAAHFEVFEGIYGQQGPMLQGPMPEGELYFTRNVNAIVCYGGF